MSNEIWWLTVISLSTLGLQVFAVYYLVKTRGAAPQTRLVLDDIAGIRAQQSSHHDETIGLFKVHASGLRWIFDAFDVYILRKKPDVGPVGKPPKPPKPQVKETRQ